MDRKNESNKNKNSLHVSKEHRQNSRTTEVKPNVGG